MNGEGSRNGDVGGGVESRPSAGNSANGVSPVGDFLRNNPSGAGQVANGMSGASSGQPVGAPAQPSAPQQPVGQSTVVPNSVQNATQSMPKNSGAGEQPKQKFKKGWLISGAVGVLVLVLAGVGVWVLVGRQSQDANGNNAGPTETVSYALPEDEEEASELIADAVGRAKSLGGILESEEATEDEIKERIDAQLAEIDNDAERFEFIIYLAMLLTNAERPQLSIWYLETIDESLVDDQQLFRLYTSLDNAYLSLGDEESASKYEAVIFDGRDS